MENQNNIGATTNKINVENVFVKIEEILPYDKNEKTEICFDIYESWEECFKSLKPNIILDCKKLGYTKKGTEAVLLKIKCKLLGI